MKLSGHILSYEWRGFKPVLSIYDGVEVHEIDLSSIDRFEFKIGKERRCIGRFEDGEYLPCPDGAILTGPWNQCPSCAEPSIPDLSCIFEPKCDGSLCGVEFCSRPHVVYLAINGSLLKIGMTSEKRVEQRLIEQGADAYAVLYMAENRLEARKMEKKISSVSGIRQAHSKKDVLSEMRRKPDKDGIKILFTSVVEDIGDPFGPVPELHILDGYPIELPLRRAPFLLPSPGRHSGRLLGLKGRYLIYSAPGIYAIDMSESPGRMAKISVNFK